MIQALFRNPHVLYQTPDDENGLPEPAIAGSVDAAGLLILSQEGREILINRASVNELIKLLRALKATGSQQ